jgi:2-keto-3-deoxy-L-rhamnonate aldolase RhmA
MLRVFGAFETTPMVRVMEHGHGYLKRVLNARALALMIPEIELEDQAHLVVAACCYPPLG